MCAILGSLPFLGTIHNVSFDLCVKMTLFVQTIAVLNNNGMIKFNKEYLRSIAFDEEAHYLIGAFLLLISAPNIMANLPQACRSALFIATSVQLFLPTMIPMLWGVAGPMITRFVSKRAEVYSFCSSMEVMTVFVLMFELLTPARNFMLVLMYWQYLRLRYMLSFGTKQAFASVNSQLNLWLCESSWCPKAVGSLYTKLATYIHSYVDPHQNQSSASSLASKCEIM